MATISKSQKADKRSWRDTIKIHPAAEAFPLMADAELRELGEDIKKNGLTSPVVIYAEQLDTGNLDSGYRYLLLDGRNRLDAMEAVGIAFTLARHRNKKYALCWELSSEDLSPTPQPIVRTKGDGDPFDYAIAANIRRRHLNAEQRIALAEQLRKLQPGVSNRRIAQQAGVSPTTAVKVTQKLEEAGDVSTMDTSTDTKGRQQPRSRRPRGGNIKIEGGLPGPNPEKARDTWRAEPTRHDEPAPNGEVLAFIPGIGSPVSSAPELGRREHAAFQISACLENLTGAEISPAELVSYLHTVHGTEWIAEKIERARRLLQDMAGEMDEIDPNYLEVLKAIQTGLDAAAS